MKYLGAVVYFDKSWGYLFCDVLGRRVFFHVTAIKGVNPKIGDFVQFELGPSLTPRKPDCAKQIEYVVASAPSAQKVGA